MAGARRAEAFLAFIEEELKPEIEKEFNIDKRRQTIFGHSLGGLFVLHMLFVKPRAFGTYIAGSPSIHWNKKWLLQKEQEFVERLAAEPVEAGIYLAAGELEQTHKSKINDNARELGARLAACGHSGLRVVYKEFEGEGHITVLPVLISHAIRFALSGAARAHAPQHGIQR